MAVTAPVTTSEFSGFLSPEQSAPIFDRAARMSVVQRLSPQVPLAANGKAIPITTGKVTAGWTNEGAKKHVSKGTMGLKTITPKKLTCIVPISAEVVRANPGGFVTNIRTQIAGAFATAFDLAALYDRGGDGTAGGGPFSTWIAQTTKAVELGTTTKANGGVWGDLVAGLSLLVNDGKRLRGFALDERIEPMLLGAVDNNGRPLFVEQPLDATTAALFEANPMDPARPGRLMGRPSWMTEGIGEPTPGTTSTTYTLGFGGDWSQTAWGVVGGITYDVSTQTTLTIDGQLVSLWENNLMAVKAEAEYGWLVNDTAAFVEYTETTAA